VLEMGNSPCFPFLRGQSATQGASAQPKYAGQWASGPLALSLRTGWAPAFPRREVVDPEANVLGAAPESGVYSWLIVDTDGNDKWPGQTVVEWCLGRSQCHGSVANTNIHKGYAGRILEFGETMWTPADNHLSLVMPIRLEIKDEVYVEFEGIQLLVAMTVNDVVLERVVHLDIDDERLFMLMSEAENFEVNDRPSLELFYPALKAEMTRIADGQLLEEEPVPNEYAASPLRHLVRNASGRVTKD